MELAVKYIECACQDVGCTLRFDLYEEDGELIITTHLSTNGFFARVKNAIKYIFGYKTKFGCFNDTLLERDQILELRDLCNYAIAKINKPKKTISPDEFRQLYQVISEREKAEKQE